MQDIGVKLIRMSKKHWIETGLVLQCVKCDFYCQELTTMLGHQTTKHIKKKTKVKRHKKEIPNLLPIKGVYDGRFIP